MAYKLTYDDKILRKKSKEVENFDIKLKNVVDKMFDAMYKFNGIGLAAPQVGINLRIFVIDISIFGGKKMAFINPEIVFKSQNKNKDIEQCLSIPKTQAKIDRSNKIEISFQNLSGKLNKINAFGLFARIIQHELDHLNGILFTDYISNTKLT